MRKGTPRGLLTGGSDVKNDVALGTGIMDWPAILEAASEVGIKHYFIEDESPRQKSRFPSACAFWKRSSGELR